MNGDLEPDATAGFIASDLRAELPGLRLDWLAVEGRRRASPPEVQRRLRQLSGRYRGASVVAMRTQPIAHAYRAFYRQIGLDPDTNRIPSEEVAVARLLHGGFRSRDLVQDALLIALIETGVPVWALDADLVDPGGLGIRSTLTGDRLGTTGQSDFLPPGRLVVVDARTVHALLFGAVAPGHGVGPRTARIALYAVGVDGVPAIHIEEAIWACVEVLKSG